MLIRDRLDTAFDNEPPHLPIEQRLAAGRAALRRRRIGQSVAAVAAVAVVAVGSVALGGRSADSGQRIAPATNPRASSAGPTDDGSPTTQAARWPYPEQLAYVDATGRVRLAPGVRLAYKVTSPAKAPDDKAIQVAVRSDQEVWWLAMTWRRGAEAIAYNVVGPFDTFQSARFHDWVLQQSYRAGFSGPTSSDGSTGSAISADEELVRFESGTLVAQPGVVIQQQRADPGFTNFNLDGEAVAVAEVRVQDDGTRWFVIARENANGSTQNISARPGVQAVPDELDAFIAWARTQYDSGVGLL